MAFDEALAARISGSQRTGWQVGLASWAVLCVLVVLTWWWPARHPRAVPAVPNAGDGLRAARREIRGRRDREERRVPGRGHGHEEHGHKKRGLAKDRRARELGSHEDSEDHEGEEHPVRLRHVGYAFFLNDSRWGEEVTARRCPDRDT